MKLKLVRLALAMVAQITHVLALGPLQNSVIGDDVVENISLPTKAPTFDVSRVVAKAKSLDPVNGAAIEQALSSTARIKIVQFHAEGNFGIHDYNTIGLNSDYPLLVMAVALLHEWEHVKDCGDGPGNGGVANSPAASNCSACEHLPLTAASYVLLFNNLCDLPCQSMSSALLKKACESLREFKELSKDQNTRCQASTCGNKPSWSSLANWSATCPCCP
jgi:hypothetical protein